MTWLRSGACSLSIDDLGRRDELDWDAATPHVRDAGVVWQSIMGERVKREATGDEHSDEAPQARSVFL